MPHDKKNREILESYFLTGLRPKQSEFAEFIESVINKVDDHVHVDRSNTNDPKIGIGTETPSEKLDVNGNINVQGNIHGSAANNILTIGQGAVKRPFISFYGLNSQGPWINPGQLRFNAGDGTENPDKQGSNTTTGGFTFIQHIDDNDPNTSNWKTLMEIKKDGNVGIGTHAPTEKLEVNGNIKINNNDLFLRTDNYHGLGYYGNDINKNYAGVDVGGPVVYGFNGGALGTSQFNNNKNIALRWLHNGNVGIGTDNPNNKLEINSAGTDTGLRLSNGKGDDKVLTSDSDGNTIWKESSEIKNGLWKKGTDPDDIQNGNVGNVGIGISDPKEKLHVNGNVKIEGKAINWENGDNKFEIKRDNTKGSYIEMLGSDLTTQDANNNVINHPNQGGIAFVARGNGDNNGFNFTHHIEGSTSWKRSLRLDGNGDSHFESNTIYLRLKDHGLGWFGTTYNGNTKLFNGNNVNGPVLFGARGGALASGPIDTGNIALQWFSDKRVEMKGNLQVDGDTNFKGDVLVQGKKLIHMTSMFERSITFNINNLINPIKTSIDISTGLKIIDYPLHFIKSEWKFKKDNSQPEIIDYNLSIKNVPPSLDWQIRIEGQSKSILSASTWKISVNIIFFRRELVNIDNI